MSTLVQRQQKKQHKVHLVTKGVYPLSTPTLPANRKNEEWLIVLHCVSDGERGQKDVGGVREQAAGNTRLQPCPPPDLFLSPLCRVIKGKTIFSYCFIKHYVGLFITFSPDSYSIPVAAVCTAPDRTEKAFWSSFRWNMELTESVTPPPHTHTNTQRDTACNCVCFLVMQYIYFLSLNVLCQVTSVLLCVTACLTCILPIHYIVVHLWRVRLCTHGPCVWMSHLATKTVWWLYTPSSSFV